jgi:hypothetical protein
VWLTWWATACAGADAAAEAGPVTSVAAAIAAAVARRATLHLRPLCRDDMYGPSGRSEIETRTSVTRYRNQRKGQLVVLNSLFNKSIQRDQWVVFFTVNIDCSRSMSGIIFQGNSKNQVDQPREMSDERDSASLLSTLRIDRPAAHFADSVPVHRGVEQP